MSVDVSTVRELWEMFPGVRHGRLVDLVAGLLRGRQTYSLSDPGWVTFNMGGRGRLRLGPLRCEAEGRTYATVVLTAYALGEACPLPLAALASRLLVEGRAQPVEVLPC